MTEGVNGPGDARWWLEPEGQKHERMLAVVRSIRQNQEYRKLTDLLHESLYGNTPATAYGRGAARRFSASSKLSLNVVRTMIGAATSKIAAKNKPKPSFITEDGNYDQRIQAENLEAFVGGVFEDAEVYPTVVRGFRDMGIYGTAFVNVYDQGGRVHVERMRQREMVVDDVEGADMDPRNIYRRRYYDRLVVAKLWGLDDPERERLIRDCPRDTDDVEAGYQSVADQLLVTEGWHLGEDDSTPGRHVIAIDNLTLLDEEWEGPFPFAVMRWSEDVDGYFGIGLAEELRGIQAEINKLLQQIQKGHHLIAGHWLVQQGSMVTAQINNDLAAIVKYAGTRPEYQTPAIIAPEVYQHLWQLYAKAFEITGISQLSATGMKPAGLDSGEAQRVYNDIQTERFLEVGQAFERFVVDVAKQVIRCAKRIGGTYTVRAVGKGGYTTIKWSEVNLDDSQYVIRCYPTSLLPTLPAGRIQWAEDRVKAGLIPAEEALDLIDHPDTSAFARRVSAPRRVIERNISHILKTGQAVSPEPNDNHELALKLVNLAYHEARLDMVPESKLQLLRDYMAVTKSFLPKPAQPAASPMAAGTPMPNPAPPPPAVPVAA